MKCVRNYERSDASLKLWAVFLFIVFENAYISWALLVHDSRISVFLCVARLYACVNLICPKNILYSSLLVATLFSYQVKNQQQQQQENKEKKNAQNNLKALPITFPCEIFASHLRTHWNFIRSACFLWVFFHVRLQREKKIKDFFTFAPHAKKTHKIEINGRK